MKIGLAYDLKSDMAIVEGCPDDALEEVRRRGNRGKHSPSTYPVAPYRVVRLGGGRNFVTAVLREKVDMVFTIAGTWKLPQQRARCRSPRDAWNTLRWF